MKRVMSAFLAFLMIITVVPHYVSSDGGIAGQAESDNGVVLNKSASLHTGASGAYDGTLDINIEAYTTGQVTSSSTSTPTDIVLVLDVSGSMADSISTENVVYEKVLGTERDWIGLVLKVGTLYGVHGNRQYYIKQGNDYVPVVPTDSVTSSGVLWDYTEEGYDDNFYSSFVMEGDTSGKRYYPTMEEGYDITPESGVTYEIVDFYQRTSTSTSNTLLGNLQSAVKEFVDATLANSDPNNPHRISIVKFAAPRYKTQNNYTTDITQVDASVVGNHIYGSNDYNYTQVVQGLTDVTTANVNTIKSNVDSLTAGGATAVDYGLALAEDVLKDRTAHAGREAVVIVFTDGSPTHNNGFEKSTAAVALGYANDIKIGGYEIYAISVADGADPTQAPDVDNYNSSRNFDTTKAINTFMHALSSNYPDAVANTGNNNTLTLGTANAKQGYYMAADNADAINNIFKTIATNIGKPTIELGQNAAVVDEISPYFTIPNGANSISISVIPAKLENGSIAWDTAKAIQNPAGISVEVSGSKQDARVTGFDFDANYVTETARTADNLYNLNGHGAKLVITINVKPDYTVIDTASLTAASGLLSLPTNADNAADLNMPHGLAIHNSSGATVATKASPSVTAYAVEYRVDGQVTKTVYRFPGAAVKVDAAPVKTGYTFSGWQMDGAAAPASFTMPEGKVVISGTFAKDAYTVTYQLIDAPAGVQTPTDNSTYGYGDSVTLADIPAYNTNEYTFSGWYPRDTGITITDGKITMPAHDVTIYGRFNEIPVEQQSAYYRIEHWLEDPNNEGSFILDAQNSTPENAPIRTYPREISGTPRVYHGYEFAYCHIGPDKCTDNCTHSVIVAVTETGVIQFYYTLESMFTVTYTVADPIPAEIADTVAQMLAADYAEEIYGVGADVAYKPKLSIDGYVVSNWTASPAVTDLGGGKFDMPAENVVFSATILPATGREYEVNYWLETKNAEAAGAVQNEANQQYYVKYTGTDPHGSYSGNDAHTGQLIRAHAHAYTGYTANTDISTWEGVIPATGKLVLNVYYDLTEYTVEYKYLHEPDTGAPELPATKTYTVEDTVIMADDLVFDGHTFSGWMIANIPGTEIKVTENAQGKKEFEMPAANVVINGSFTKNFMVTYWVKDADGNATQYAGPFSHPAGASFTLNGAHVTNPTVGTEEEFSGWNEVVYADGTNTPVTITEGKFTMPATNVNVYGTLKVKQHSITYWLIDESGTAIPYVHDTIEKWNVNTSHILGQDIDPVVVADGYRFEGWTVVQKADDDTVVVDIEENAFIMPDYDVNVYGWITEKPVEYYTVTYYVNNEVYATYEVAVGETHRIIRTPYYAEPMIFEGWSDPLNETTGQYFRAVDGAFVMPASDVSLYGTVGVQPFPPEAYYGRVTIEKELIAPAGFPVTTFAFSIYRGYGSKLEYVDTVEVEAGSQKTIALEAGVYYIYEEDAEVDGYILESETDREENRVNVTASRAVAIRFTNTYEAILQLEDHYAYIIGYPDGTVRPEANITRAEAATIFFRMLTDEARAHYWSQTNNFTDVSAEDWFNNAISTLANAGVLNGYEDNTYRPNEYITRAELVKIAVSFYGTVAGQSTQFSDVSEHWAEDFIVAAEALGFVNGYEDGSFRPDQYISRAEAMKIINRTLQRNPDKDHLLQNMIKWSDNMDTSKWYYADVQEATNSHIYYWDAQGYEIWDALLPVRDWAALEKEWSKANNK